MKKFKNFLNENKIDEELKNDIIKYLEENYPENWWNDQLSERVFDYINEEEVIGEGDEDDESTWDYESHEDAYRNLATGGAIEYDILEQINNEVMKKFNIDKMIFIILIIVIL